MEPTPQARKGTLPMSWLDAGLLKLHKAKKFTGLGEEDKCHDEPSVDCSWWWPMEMRFAKSSTHGSSSAGFQMRRAVSG